PLKDNVVIVLPTLRKPGALSAKSDTSRGHVGIGKVARQCKKRLALKVSLSGLSVLPAAKPVPGQFGGRSGQSGNNGADDYREQVRHDIPFPAARNNANNNRQGLDICD